MRISISIALNQEIYQTRPTDIISQFPTEASSKQNSKTTNDFRMFTRV